MAVFGGEEELGVAPEAIEVHPEFVAFAVVPREAHGDDGAGSQGDEIRNDCACRTRCVPDSDHLVRDLARLDRGLREFGVELDVLVEEEVPYDRDALRCEAREDLSKAFFFHDFTPSVRQRLSKNALLSTQR